MHRYDKLIEIRQEYSQVDNTPAASIGYILLALSDAGFLPGIYKRGKYWRMHIDCATNCWHDGKTPMSAFRGVLKQELKLEKNKVAL